MRKVLCAALLIMLCLASCSWGVVSIQVTGNPPDGTVGSYYSYTFRYTTTGTNLKISKWRISGSVPDGLSFNTMSGTLSGFPTEAKRYSFNVWAITDDDEWGAEFSITINPKDSDNGGGGGGNNNNSDSSQAPTITGTLGGGTVGEDFAWHNQAYIGGRIHAENGSAPYTWSVTNGEIPIGLHLACTDAEGQFGLGNVFTGKYFGLMGIPVSADTYEVTLKVTDSQGRSASSSLKVGINSNEQGSDNINNLLITGDSERNLQPTKYIYLDWYHSLDEAWYAKNGRAPYTWSVISGKLPKGATLRCGDVYGTWSSNQTGRIASIYRDDFSPQTENGTYKFLLKVTDSEGRMAIAPCTITITGCDSNDPDDNGSASLTYDPIPTITGTFARGTKGTTYSDSVSVTGGTAPYTWSVSNAMTYRYYSDYGKLPPGLTMSGGRITGTPTERGYYNFTLKVQDSKGMSAAKTFMIRIDESTASTTPTPNPNTEQNEQNEQNVTPNPNTEQTNSQDITPNPDTEQTDPQDVTPNPGTGQTTSRDVSTNPSPNTNNMTGSSGGGGGCNAGLGIIALLALAFKRSR